MLYHTILTHLLTLLPYFLSSSTPRAGTHTACSALRCDVFRVDLHRNDVLDSNDVESSLVRMYEL